GQSGRGGLMKPILIAVILSATATAMALATAASPRADSIDGFVRSAIVGKASVDARPAYLRAPEPDYIVYSGYSAALPEANCYWTRMPVYNANGDVIGWRGRPVAVCP